MQGLTARQAAVLQYISDYLAANGCPPSLREIGAAFNIRSTNGVNDHLRALERKGRIVRRSMSSRGIRIISPETGKPAPLPDPVGFVKAENKALRGLLQRILDSSSRGQYLTAEMVIVLGDVRSVLRAAS